MIKPPQLRELLQKQDVRSPALVVESTLESFDWNSDEAAWESQGGCSRFTTAMDRALNGRHKVTYAPRIFRWHQGSAPYFHEYGFLAFDGSRYALKALPQGLESREPIITADPPKEYAFARFYNGEEFSLRYSKIHHVAPLLGLLTMAGPPFRFHFAESMEKGVPCLAVTCGQDFPFDADKVTQQETLYLDLAHDLRLLKRVHEKTNRNLSRTSVECYEIEKFAEVEEGIFYPTEATFHSTLNGAPERKREFKASKISVHNELPEEAFGF